MLPASVPNRIERVAIVGAGGQMGAHFAKALLQTGRHTVTALTRHGSKNQLPTGVIAAMVDYNDESTIVAALQGQQFLIITLAPMAPPDTQSKIIQAAAKAGVTRIMPNIYGYDYSNEALVQDSPLSGDPSGTLAEIEAAGCSGTPMICNLWYEYSLAMGPIWFGFDFSAKKLTLYDDGTTKVNLTTWDQCARAAVALLSLKERPEDEHDRNTPTVDTWRNRPLVISSFLVSQRDIFASWKRVSGDSDAQWTIESEPSSDRHRRGLMAMKAASDPMAAQMGAATASFARLFYRGGGGDYQSTRGLDNAALGLPQEDLDERTAVAKQMVEQQYAAKLFAKIAAGA